MWNRPIIAHQHDLQCFFYRPQGARATWCCGSRCGRPWRLRASGRATRPRRPRPSWSTNTESSANRTTSATAARKCAERATTSSVTTRAARTALESVSTVGPAPTATKVGLAVRCSIIMYVSVSMYYISKASSCRRLYSFHRQRITTHCLNYLMIRLRKSSSRSKIPGIANVFRNEQ